MQIADRDQPAVSACPPRQIASRGILVALLATFATAAFASQGTAPAQAETCPNAQFRTGPSAHLPDCRAYELVTPPEKDGAEAELRGIAADGETLSFLSTVGFGSPEGAEGFPGFVYAATRQEPGGWGTSFLNPSQSRFLNLEAGGLRAATVVGRSGDGRTDAWLLHERGQPENSAAFYLTTAGGGEPVQIGPALPPGASSIFPQSRQFERAQVTVDGLSADASRLVFHAGEPGHPGEAGDEWQFPSEPGVSGPHALLEYIGTGNTAPLPLIPHPVEDDECNGQVLGGQLTGQSRAPTEFGGVWTKNAISLDGETIFLTDLCKHQIFARLENGRPGAHTVALSEPSPTDCETCQTYPTEPQKRSPAYYLGASQDGSRMFFTTKQPLLGGDSSENVYEYDFNAPEGQRVTRVSAPDGSVPLGEVGPTGVEGFLQVSQDGSHVYFVAAGVLSTNPNSHGQKAHAGEHNLYVYDTETANTKFIATLPTSDAILWGANETGNPGLSESTPNGQYLLFASHADLTPDDTSSAAQIFKYDALTGALLRVSIAENGINNNGNNQLLTPKAHADFNSDELFGDPNDAVIPNNSSLVSPFTGPYTALADTSLLAISENGEYIFFQSSDALTEDALNHVELHPIQGEHVREKILAVNVYEYHQGHVYLISDGRDTGVILGLSVVELLGTDLSGRDVFFTTLDQLVAQDTDTSVDVYDARIDGGFPAPPAPVGCAGDACQGALSGVPTLLSPGSEHQAGETPPLTAPAPAVVAKPKAKPKKCKKHTTLKHGKCQKTRAKRASRNPRTKS